jgi:hypothetical protein
MFGCLDIQTFSLGMYGCLDAWTSKDVPLQYLYGCFFKLGYISAMFLQAGLHLGHVFSSWAVARPSSWAVARLCFFKLGC